MRFIKNLLVFLLFTALMLYLGWPYFTLYRLDVALRSNDEAALNQLIDLQAIRATYKQRMSRQVNQAANALSVPANPLSSFLQSGAQALGDTAVDNTVNIAWVRERLLRDPALGGTSPAMLHNISFAFFERPWRFLTRIGELDGRPLHFYMAWQDLQLDNPPPDWFWQHGMNRWKVSAVYE